MPAHQSCLIKLLLSFLITSAIFLSSPNSKIALAGAMINELLPDPSGDEKIEEWVELYNTDETSLDIAGYKLKDAADHELVISSDYTEGSTTILGKSWLLIKRNNHPDFSLNNSGTETITLWNNATPSAQLDSFSYSGSVENKSWGRIPDGGAVATEKLDPTPGMANYAPTPTPEPTNTPTPTPKPPTPTPTPKSPTPTPTSLPSPTLTPKAVAVVGTTLSGEILGEEESSPEAFYPWEATAEAEVQEATPLKRRILPILFLGLGLTFLAAAAFSLYTRFRWPEQENS